MNNDRWRIVRVFLLLMISLVVIATIAFGISYFKVSMGMAKAAHDISN